MRRRRHGQADVLRKACLALCVAMVAACGSTVQSQSQVRSGGGPSVEDGLAESPGLALDEQVGAPGSGTGPAADATSAEANDGSSRTDGAPPGAASAGGPGAQGQPGAPGAPRPTEPEVAGPPGPGVTDRTITIGVTYYENAAAANAALGAGGVETGDPVAGTRALIDDINRRGGVAGRKLEVLFWSFDPQSTQTYAAAGQEMCTHFTEDNKVLAVIDGAPAAGKEARGCLADRGVVYQGASLLTTGDLVRGEIDVTSMTFDRLFAELPHALQQQGWFGGWDHATGAPGPGRANVGILTVDTPALSRAVDRVLVPALRRVGYAPDPDNIVRISRPGGSRDNGAVAAAIHGAVLKFRSNGVAHVILTDANGSMSLLFQNDAFSQGYFPRYGGSSGNGWQVLLDAGAIQAKTLVGAMGVGWQPLLDLPYTSGDGPYPTPERKRCFAVFRASGQPHQGGNSAGGQAAACDTVYFLSRVLDGHEGVINRDVVVALTERLGTRYPTAATVGLRFGPSKYDGAGAYFGMSFKQDCSCFSYTGSRNAL